MCPLMVCAPRPALRESTLWSLQTSWWRLLISQLPGIPAKALMAGWQGLGCRALGALASAAQETSCPASQCTAQPRALCPSFEPARTVAAQGKATRRLLKGPSSASGFKSLLSLVSPVSLTGIRMLLTHPTLLHWTCIALSSGKLWVPSQCAWPWLSQAAHELGSCACSGTLINLWKRTWCAHVNLSQAKE